MGKIQVLGDYTSTFSYNKSNADQTVECYFPYIQTRASSLFLHNVIKNYLTHDNDFILYLCGKQCKIPYQNNGRK